MPADIPQTMRAVLLTGHGGFDKLHYRTDVPVPKPRADEVLIKVGAAAINNTDINTRTAWYSKAVSAATADGATRGFTDAKSEDAGWTGDVPQFPRIQGADACGRIVAVGDSVSPARLGARVLVEPLFRGAAPFEATYFGSEVDGAFAEYACAPAVHAHMIESDLSDAELSSFPCAYSAAENMLSRARVSAEELVVVTGASGGVGSAAVQLAKLRGARVIAVCGNDKFGEVGALGADQLIARDADIVSALGDESVDAVIDVVGGANFGALLTCLRRGGRYAVAGAIAGPIVELDLRTLYLKDLSLFGCTVIGPAIFPNLIHAISSGGIQPIIAETYPLSQIIAAQQSFLAKRHVGKIVLIP